MSDGALSKAVTEPCLPTARLEALKTWLASNNVHLSSKLAIRAVPSDADAIDRQHQGSFAVYALDDIQQDEILAVTPRTAILSRRTCSLASSPAFQDLCAFVQSATSQQAGVRILATALTYEILLESKSKWYGYIQSMPQSYHEIGLPTFWQDETALQWLQGTDVLAYMEQQKCTKAEMNAFYHDMVLPCLQTQETSLVSTESAFKLAFSLVLSRAFYVDNYHGLSMVPLADVFNHHCQSQAILQSDDIVCATCGSRTECEHDDAQTDVTGSSGMTDDAARYNTLLAGADHLESAESLDADAVDMIATASIYPEDEVFNTYGRLDNASLLVNYGFTLEANEDDKVRWFSVTSLLEQAGLKTGNVENLTMRWRTSMKDYTREQASIEDDRLSDQRVVNAHLRDTHETLFIDADGSVSAYLVLLIKLAMDEEAGSSWREPDRSEGRMAEVLEKLVRNRLHELSNGGHGTNELFDLVAQRETGREVKMAISRVLDERLLLTACLSQWRPEAVSSDEES